MEPIVADRLELVHLTPEMIEALLDDRRGDAECLGGFSIPASWPDIHDRRLLALRLRQTQEDPAQSEWLVRAVLLREPGRPMIGHVGFHGAPGRNSLRDPSAVEVGYTIFPEHRGRGYATEAVRALVSWAEERGITHFIASIGPQNAPSLALARRLGFRETGRHWDDEDGEELEFELETRLSGSGS